MCETCRQAPGFETMGPDDPFPCMCPCPIKNDTKYLYFRPLICSECCHVALD